MDKIFSFFLFTDCKPLRESVLQAVDEQQVLWRRSNGGRWHFIIL